MPELGSLGTVRGAPGNGRPYREHSPKDRPSNEPRNRPRTQAAVGGGLCFAAAFSAIYVRRDQAMSEEEHHVLLDGLAVDVQLVGGEVWVGIADCQAA